MSSRLNTLGKNTASNFVFFIFTKGLSLINYALLLRFLGLESYGLLIFANSILGQLDFLQGGLGTALEKYIPEYLTQKKYHKLNNSFTVTFIYFLLIGLLISVLLIIISITSIIEIFDISNLTKARHILIYAAVFAPISWGGNSLVSTLKGFNDHHYINKIETLRFVSAVITTVLLAYLGVDIVIIFLTQQCINLVKIVIFYLRINSKHKIYLRFKTPKILFATFKHIFSYSFWVFLIEMSSYAINRFDKIIVSAFLGVGLLPIYIGILKLMKLIVDMNSKFNSAVVPIASELYQESSLASFNSKVLRGVTAVNAITAPICAISVIYAKPLLYLVGKEHLLSYVDIFQIGLIFYMIITSKSFFQKMVIGSGKKIERLSYISIATASFYLLSISKIIELFGVEGAILAMPSIHLLIFPFWIMLIVRSAEIRVTEFIKSILQGLLPSLLLIVVHIMLVSFILSEITYVYYVTMGLIGLPVMILLVYKYSIEDSLKNMVINRIREGINS